MIEGKDRFINRPTKTEGKLYDKHFIYIPTEVVGDNSFPFRVKEIVRMRIDKESSHLIIEKL